MDNLELKYVILTFLNYGGYVVGETSFKDRNDIIGYIVSPAFLINREKEEAEVVLPYRSVLDKEMIIPSFENGKCLNSYRVNKIFDSFFEAQNYKEYINDKLIEEVATNIYLECMKKNVYRYIIEEKESSIENDLLLLDEIEFELFNKSKNILRLKK